MRVRPIARRLVIMLAALAVATVAGAQAVTNPNSATVQCSPDHAVVAGYTVGIFKSPTDTSPMLIDVAKPVPDTSGNCTLAFNTQPLAIAAGYLVKVRVYLGTMVSDWTVPSDPFDRAPGPPGGKPALSKK